MVVVAGTKGSLDMRGKLVLSVGDPSSLVALVLEVWINSTDLRKTTWHVSGCSKKWSVSGDAPAVEDEPLPPSY